MRGRVLMVLFLVLMVVVVVASTVSYVRHRSDPVVVDAACPPLLPHTSNATDDYGDTVHWDGRTWWRTEGRTKADGNVVGVVTCTVAEIPNENGWRVSPRGWADGTATVLPKGTRLTTASEERIHEALVASTAGGDVLYCPGAPGTC
ncbi:hypothetical protein [Microlunatus flavus]|uniref:Uncharacterized protein n=1 Tax=Microlunatus flavus TaxID=1036181 RepID=A0A1H9CP83_9ACTN|nr:hypothetical protein [Microlunatus flavus]SEQ02438.1 hypothetical protein SAMN05421756_102265 [Microlunatus flavus]